jgi:hypothetical protein
MVLLPEAGLIGENFEELAGWVLDKAIPTMILKLSSPLK